MEFTAERTRSVYLNIDFPAPCSGTISRWRYCYYRPANLSGERYLATWAVYRRTGTGDNSSYVMVNSSLQRVTRDNQTVGANGMDFVCRNRNAGPSDIKVETGDVVGACIYDPTDLIGQNVVRKQLDIIGQASGYSLMKKDDVSECGPTSMPSVISNSSLSRVDSTILHLYTIINSMLMCMTQYIKVTP